MNMVDDIKKTAIGTIGKYKPYPGYKESCVEWLGKIPESWGIKRLKYLSTINSETLPEDCDPGLEITYIDIGSVDNLGKIENKESLVFSNAPSRARRIVRDGDVIVSTVRTYLRAIAPIKKPERGTIVSTGFAVVRPRAELESGYFVYALRAPYFVERIVANSKGVSFPAISETEMATYEIAIPPIPEQRAIATFLDRETARIDELVTKNEGLIALLQEKRAALITRAVTKGIDPNVPMKDSGVEWLGEIPAHWEEKHFKEILVRNEGGIWGEDFSDDGTIVLRSTEQTVDGNWKIESPARRQLSKREFATSRLEVDDLVVTKSSGSDLHIGKTSIVDENIAKLNCCFSNFMQRLRVNSKTNARFYWYMFNSPVIRDQLVFLSSTTTGLGNLNGSILGAVRVPVMDKTEQFAITAFLDHETMRINELIAKVRDAIDLLKEYRSALISAAVTGKIDVRGEAE